MPTMTGITRKRKTGIVCCELQSIQKENGLYKYAGKSRAFVEKYIMESVPSGVLEEQIVDILFERDYSIFKK